MHTGCPPGLFICQQGDIFTWIMGVGCHRLRGHVQNDKPRLSGPFSSQSHTSAILGVERLYGGPKRPQLNLH